MTKPKSKCRHKILQAYSSNAMLECRDCEMSFVEPSVVDDFVVMRYAKLVEEGKVKEIEKRAIKNCEGNIGCDALRKKYGKETVMEEAERAAKKEVR